jgi:hypothetical protein
MLPLAAAFHDLALALLTGGLAGVFLAVGILFEKAPSREIAGQVGNVIFGRLGPAALTLAVIVFATELILVRGKERGGRTALILSLLTFLMVGAAALFLTPRMTGIWLQSPHAPDGTGLMGEEKRRFLAMHVASNLAYMGALLAGVGRIVLRAIGSRRTETG